MNTNHLTKKKNFHVFCKALLNKKSFIYCEIYISFSFCSDFNLEATVVKTDKIRGLKQLFSPFSLNWKIFFSKIINN